MWFLEVGGGGGWNEAVGVDGCGRWVMLLEMERKKKQRQRVGVRGFLYSTAGRAASGCINGLSPNQTRPVSCARPTNNSIDLPHPRTLRVRT